MPLEIIPSNDRWETRTLDVASAATFVYGSALKLNGARNVVEATSFVTDTTFLGVSTHSSTASIPAGKAVIKVPLYGARAFCPTGTHTASNLSLGVAGAWVKSGNTFSLMTTSVVTKWFTVVGPLNSSTSMIEVEILADAGQYYSTASFNY